MAIPKFPYSKFIHDLFGVDNSTSLEDQAGFYTTHIVDQEGLKPYTMGPFN